ncbi:hypothetical protein AGABI1DRAFT_126769 [Agaricus bisporus var. burnettii JB137-S8]|uniref:C2H2-type domain-containing protein n=1 Tax=Agaricus bisporus var. burnettii (strain JB137-S8 / ATCC MYA-4627 / FGSC 10392) TaxID=597362 RepID=K5XZ84_AGABU|nr:uncharacterized protein AGABI1DRAFT_126769 [Agaricus bisporus var. burnettii JB137-S8]EKM80720.1 hypothetical protein AGABI1DRAFT_126769 [Agaricus bisporus var. burnettii JB137-S8]
MSNPSDTHPGKRVTLPSIRDLFRGKVPSYQSASLHKPISADEIMQHPPGEPPSSTLARLRIDDNGNEMPHTRTQSPMPFDPSRTYRTSGPDTILPSPSTSNRPRLYSDAPRYPSTYSTPQSSSPPFYPTHSFPLSDAPPGQRPPSIPPYHTQSHPTSHLDSQPQQWPANAPSGQRPYPSHSHPNLRAHASQDSSQMSHGSSSSNPASFVPGHNLDLPPALTRAPAPWVIATNLDVGQIYEDDERTTIARPFDGNSLARSTSHAIPLGRFLDDASGTPLGKYECKICGKLFNRPSSLRIHLNSHTGEKPHVCPYPGCGRSFSVLSNMRRHARVHTHNSKEQEPEELIDESSVPPSPATASAGQASVQEGVPIQSSTDSRHHYRQDSNNSTSSSRSRGRSSGIDRVEEEEQ